MKNLTIFRVTILVFIAVTSLYSNSIAADKQTAPTTNNGEKWRIAYYEGGAYTDYTDNMRSLIEGLMNLGWIDHAPLPNIEGDVAIPYWDWLVHQSQSKYLEFRQEDAYSASWNEDTRKKSRKDAQKKLLTGDIDLIIAMGTWAGHDIANNKHHVPTMVMSTSNPIEAKIIKSIDDSVYDHVTARVDPNRYPRQIRMFHRLVGFKKLGVVYENTPDGRTYSAIADLEKLSAKRGFELILCDIIDTTDDQKSAKQACMECFEKVVQEADAVYLTSLDSISGNIENISSLLKQSKIPSFAMNGSKMVRKGILMSISNDGAYKALGLYYANKMASIFHGIQPRELEQLYPDPLVIALNMETSRIIDFPLPKSILRIANEIYGEEE